MMDNNLTLVGTIAFQNDALSFHPSHCRTVSIKGRGLIDKVQTIYGNKGIIIKDTFRDFCSSDRIDHCWRDGSMKIIRKDAG